MNLCIAPYCFYTAFKGKVSVKNRTDKLYRLQNLPGHNFEMAEITVYACLGNAGIRWFLINYSLPERLW